ncbi:hypothetical protein N658DRAFT_429839 [Parathielavia hyrcaniae]|uniref:Impact N-terminal domain-containing protein n=1 Tax=Parathielavia hyrcaniae TaxID=113614 RepID=A0AAN6Q0D2_9PEZI|nr:hypothetical protein N658DRAFT_429839 [Parathielavia hyrcaniae]
MATQQDLQELVRLLTVGRKIPMMQAMTQIKALQAADLRRAWRNSAHARRSITQIAEAPLATVQTALTDDKGARALQNACKAAVKRGLSGPNKRQAPDAAASQAKRTKTDLFRTGPVEMTPQELEKSLELPLCEDEERISRTVIETNRAPLVLAFAVELLRHTMPEQPLSSRLSLGQAVVSANSRSKAPRVKVMGREIAVLKRGGYEWKEEEDAGEQAASSGEEVSVIPETQAQTETQTSTAPATFQPTLDSAWSTWAVSEPITLKDSTFIARATPISNPSQRRLLLQSLLDSVPGLQSAAHNAWAYRLRYPPDAPSTSFVREDSSDDGEAGAGDLILGLMRQSGAVDTLVVLTRWFGGTLLGPDRWRLMRRCVASVLAERLRRTGPQVSLGGEALWGLDLEALRAKTTAAATATASAGGHGSGNRAQLGTGVVGMQIHRPEGARGYLLRSFGRVEGEGTATATATATGKSPRKGKTLKAIEAEKEENLGLLLGALRIVFDNWADHLDAAELDRRAWGWYIAVRPDVDSGQAGWGAKGKVKLSDILKLRRPPGK